MMIPSQVTGDRVCIKVTLQVSGLVKLCLDGLAWPGLSVSFFLICNSIFLMTSWLLPNLFYFLLSFV